MEDRRLAAIMFTDIVGYTALMGSDEKKAFEVLRKNRNIQKPIIAKYRGKWLKEMGDGILASFDTASEAVRCAGEIQNQAKKEDIELRIGIHTGEVVFEGNDVLGDGVNVASRLEELAEKGCIYISGSVYKDIKNKEGIRSEFVEEKTLKNVDEPVRIYRVECKEIDVTDYSTDIERRKSRNKILFFLLPIIILILVGGLIWYTLPKLTAIKTSKTIAVLPFIDLSPNQDQEYLADGVAEEIINSITKFNDLKVVGRTSSFSFKGKDIDIKTIGRKVNANLILEGSVLKSQDNIRIIVQLINVRTGFHIWSKKFESEFNDYFNILDSVSNLVVKSITQDNNKQNENFVNQSIPSNIEAYDYFLIGKYLSESKFQTSFEIADYELAQTAFKKSIDLDNKFALPHAGLADLYHSYQGSYLIDDNNPEKKKYINLQLKEIEIAYNLDPKNDYINRVRGWIYWNLNKFDTAYNSFKRAVDVNPKESWNLLAISYFLLDNGLAEEALLSIDRAIEIDPLFTSAFNLRGIINMQSGRYDIALKDYQNAIEMDTSNINTYYWMSVLYELIRDTKNAQAMWNIMKSLMPNIESILKIKINIFNTVKGREAFHEYKIVESLLQGEFDKAKELLIEDKKLLFNYNMLNNMHLFDSLRNNVIFIDLLEKKKSEYLNLKLKYGNLDFLSGRK